MDRDGALLAKLLLGLVDLGDELQVALGRLGNALFRPVREVELTDGPRLAVLHGPQRHGVPSSLPGNFHLVAFAQTFLRPIKSVGDYRRN